MHFIEQKKENIVHPLFVGFLFHGRPPHCRDGQATAAQVGCNDTSKSGLLQEYAACMHEQGVTCTISANSKKMYIYISSKAHNGPSTWDKKSLWSV